MGLGGTALFRYSPSVTRPPGASVRPTRGLPLGKRITLSPLTAAASMALLSMTSVAAAQPSPSQPLEPPLTRLPPVLVTAPVPLPEVLPRSDIPGSLEILTDKEVWPTLIDLLQPLRRRLAPDPPGGGRPGEGADRNTGAVATGKVPGSAGHADPCPRRVPGGGPGSTERCGEARAVATRRGHRQHTGPGARDPHREVRGQHPVDLGRDHRQPEPAQPLGHALPQFRVGQHQQQPGQSVAERRDLSRLSGLAAGGQRHWAVGVSGRHAIQRRIRRDGQLGSHSTSRPSRASTSSPDPIPSSV